MTHEERMSRTNWVALLKLSKEQNLPTPVLEPGSVPRGGYTITMGSFTAHNKVMSIAINSCIDFCYGWRAGIREGLGLTDHGRDYDDFGL